MMIRIFEEMALKLAELSASQIHEPKMKVDPVGKIMLSRSIELSDAKIAESPYLAHQLSMFHHR